MRLPDFLIIGAAKSGTTTLYEYLKRHPKVYLSLPKEPCFFIELKRYKEWKSWNNWLAKQEDGFLTEENVEQRELEWYMSLFREAKPDQICGEASTPYTHWPVYKAAPENIFKTIPNVKFIYIMRHPVDRAYSHYVQLIKNAQVRDPNFEITKTFEESIENDELYLATSNYIEQIEKYLYFFPRESFLFFLMEDLIEKPKSTLGNICDFLEIDNKVDLIKTEEVVANTAKHHNDWFVRSKMTSSFKSIPGMKPLIKLVPQPFKDWTYAGLEKIKKKEIFEDRYIPKKMLPETRQRLLDFFNEPNQKLADFLGRDLSHWNY